MQISFGKGREVAVRIPKPLEPPEKNKVKRVFLNLPKIKELAA
jgi:hypothetical protein